MLYQWHTEADSTAWCESVKVNPAGAPNMTPPLQMGGRVEPVTLPLGQGWAWHVEIDVNDSIFKLLSGVVDLDLFPNEVDQVAAAKANVECLLDLFISGSGNLLGHAAVMTA